MESLTLMVSAIAALIIIIWSIKGLNGLEDKDIKITANIFFILGMLKYVTVILYYFLEELKVLLLLRYFYFMSSLSLTMLIAMAIWYVTPFLKERKKLDRFLIYFLPWIIFYIYFVLKQPTQLSTSSLYHYDLVIIQPFTTYFMIAELSFSFVIMSLCCIGMNTYKHLQIRVELLLLLLASVLLAIDALYLNSTGLRCFKIFTVSEIFAYWVCFYTLSHAIKPIKAIKNQ